MYLKGQKTVMKKLVVNLYFKINEIIAASCLSAPFQFDSPRKNSNVSPESRWEEASRIHFRFYIFFFYHDGI